MISSRVSQILYGASYHPEQFPEAAWTEDVELMKRAGVNVVTLGTFSWAKLQPHPGTYTFDWLDRVVALLHKEGVAINLATATASPPPWLARLHPDSLPLNADGIRASTGSRQNYCPNNAAYRDFAGQLVREIATRYGKHPALAMWQVNHQFGGQTSACYCERCATYFRTWLQQKYRTLDNLNDHWGTAV